IGLLAPAVPGRRVSLHHQKIQWPGEHPDTRSGGRAFAFGRRTDCRRLATVGRSSQKSETRISAIADFAPKGKREKKALPLSPPPPRSTARGPHLRIGDAMIALVRIALIRPLGGASRNQSILT